MHGSPDRGHMDSHVIARRVAGQLIAHRDKLAGKAADAYRAQAALEATASAVERHHADHRSTAATATGHWEGKASTAFDRKARTMTRSLDATATACLSRSGSDTAPPRAP